MKVTWSTVKFAESYYDSSCLRACTLLEKSFWTPFLNFYLLFNADIKFLADMFVCFIKSEKIVKTNQENKIVAAFVSLHA